MGEQHKTAASVASAKLIKDHGAAIGSSESGEERSRVHFQLDSKTASNRKHTIHMLACWRSPKVKEGESGRVSRARRRNYKR